MNLDIVLNELRETGSRDALEPGWDTSVVTCPDAPLDFLTPQIFLETRSWAGLPKALDPVLEKTAQSIQKPPALRVLAWHTHRLAHQTPESVVFDAWPELNHALNGSGGVFYLLIAIAGLSRLRETHEARGIPATVTQITGSDIGIGATRYGRITGGRPGIERRVVYWYSLVGSGDLHCLGRLQYPVPSGVGSEPTGIA